MSVADDLHRFPLHDAHAFEHVAQPLRLVGRHPVLQIVEEPVGNVGAGGGQVATRPGGIELVVDQLEAGGEGVLGDSGIVSYQLRPAGIELGVEDGR